MSEDNLNVMKEISENNNCENGISNSLFI